MTDVYKVAFTDQLRIRVQAVLGVCPTCGQPVGTINLSELAKEVGTSHTTIWRFLRGGRPSATLVDQIVDWLDEHEATA